jgi:hypothetical protein
LNRNSYLIINLIFIGIISAIIGYSFVFSGENLKHPIPSGPALLTGKSSPSTGLSRSFSAIVRFDFEAARAYNPYGLRIFGFFMIQLIQRIISSLLILRISNEGKNLLIIVDATISLTLFVVMFWPFINSLIKQISQADAHSFYSHWWCSHAQSCHCA